MTYEQMEQRRLELRREDPNGRRSGDDIERIVMLEDLADRIEDLPCYEPIESVRAILRDMLSVLS